MTGDAGKVDRSAAAMGEVPAGIDAANVANWLTEHVPGAEAPFAYRLVAGGRSNLTYVVTGANGDRYVLRRPPLGHLLASAHDMGREHRIIAGLQQTAVPVPPALGYCADPEVNGQPFYVMGFVDGLVLRHEEEADVLTPEARHRAGMSLAETLAAIHAVEPAAVGLGDLGRTTGYVERQLKRWHGQFHQSKTRELPAIDEVHDILKAKVPSEGPAAIVHGDFRLDNTMLDPDGTVIAVLDWEICTLGDPMADVGLLAVYYVGPGDSGEALGWQATTAPGFPTRAEVIARYAEASGRDLSAIDFYIAFGYWKLACIMEGVHSRYVSGAIGAPDAEQAAAFKRSVDVSAVFAAEYAARL